MGATQICIACIVTLWINWAHFMSWASAGTMEMMAAAQGMAGREDRWGAPCMNMDCSVHRSPGVYRGRGACNCTYGGLARD